MDNLVSIVIPCYNSEAFLEETLLSISAQDYKNIETILVDDGSTDNSVKITENLKEKLNLHIIRQQNSGVSAARNNGFLHSSGDFVVFLDSDDVIMPEFVSSKIRLLQNADYNCSGCHVYNFDSDNGTPSAFSSAPNAVSVNKNIQSDLLNYIPYFSSVPSSFVFKSSLFKKSAATPFNLKLMSTADRYLLIEYADRLRVVIDESKHAGLFYRIRKDSMSNVYNKKLIDDNALFYSELIKQNLISGNEIRKGYLLLLKSYTKIGCYAEARKYSVKLLRHQFLAHRKTLDNG